MDAAKKKALYRAKLNAQKKEKRIESPLVRYNEHDQPVCRVCDIVLKSESLWPAHQASRKHHEAIESVKAKAAALNQTKNVKPVPSPDLPKRKPDHPAEVHENRCDPSVGVTNSRPSSVLPPDFFDNHDPKKQKSDSHGSAQSQMMNSLNDESKIDGNFGDDLVDDEPDQTQLSGGIMQTSKKIVGSETKLVKGALPEGFFDDNAQLAWATTQTSKKSVGSETKQVKGALPEGFFDDRDADLRARGIEPVKIDVKDEYKEFEKAIQVDLQEVDNRMEEEEFDAAEMIEEAETVEQRVYKERVEMLKRKKLELRAAKLAMPISRRPQVVSNEFGREESSSDDDSDDNFSVDWRAKHL